MRITDEHIQAINSELHRGFPDAMAIDGRIYVRGRDITEALTVLVEDIGEADDDDRVSELLDQVYERVLIAVDEKQWSRRFLQQAALA